MGTGYLQVMTKTGSGALPVPDAKITVFNGDNILYQTTTDESGNSPIVALEAPAVELTTDPNFTGIPYSVCDVKAEAKGFATTIIHGTEILDTETSELFIDMIPSLEDGSVIDYYTPPHNLISGEQREVESPTEAPRVLSEVIIPEFITVHLGRPDNPNARNVRVPFKEYVKNSASHEIYSTWPAASLEANIYCIISFALNRIFTEWYRVRGHRFDITNSTQFDQMFVEGGQIFRTIDEMVDRIFNRFVRREGHLEPFFTEYCDGRRTQCPGLWQWSTVTLAQQGLNALQILRRFYPNDIQIVETDNIGGVPESFPGFTLQPGMSGGEVRTIQNWLNRIRVNFPTIPAVSVTGVYGPQTEAAVRAFQAIRSLSSVTPNGVVDRTTWWNLSRAYSAVKRLGELTSEGVVIGIGRTPPTEIIRQGSRGNLVGRAQYIMNFISQFYPSVPSVKQDFNFGANFADAVREFQRAFGLNPDGVIGPLTWRRLFEVYWRIRDNVGLPPTEPVIPPLPPGPPPGPGPGGIPPYPGQAIRVGARGDDVRRIQRCLNAVNNTGLNEDGIFGPLTEAAVMNFQRSRGLNPDGVVGPLTWGALMPTCYGGSMGSFPGTTIRQGDRGDNVRQVQTCLNRVINAGLATDGVFGPLTHAAVVNFQRSRGLNPDGLVGPLTWAALSSACTGTNEQSMGNFQGISLREGDRNDQVRQLQTCLNRVNNAGLAIDGVFGPLTRAAVVSYQQANGLTADGVVGPITWGHLQNHCSPAPSATRSISPLQVAVPQVAEPKTDPLPEEKMPDIVPEEIEAPANAENVNDVLDFIPLRAVDEGLSPIPAGERAIVPEEVIPVEFAREPVTTATDRRIDIVPLAREFADEAELHGHREFEHRPMEVEPVDFVNTVRDIAPANTTGSAMEKPPHCICKTQKSLFGKVNNDELLLCLIVYCLCRR